ncbi:serine/threonine-protein kinase 33-like [Oscarella lobularis]|uniref:serine/threonine-protein kinase 33-like n=1 Tax=Oscarella lobularis TaxID=121494 RepID=UPI003313B927
MASSRPGSSERRNRRLSYGGFAPLREGGVRRTRLDDESQLERHYVVGRVLGQGSFGIVKEAVDRQTSTKYAIKIINKEKAGSSAMKLMERELLILQLVEHRHIIRLEEVFETGKKMFLVLEYCEGGELQDLFKEKGHFAEDEVRTIVRRLTDAVAYMHQNNMVHRDLKLENILLRGRNDDSDDSFDIKLADFGLSYIKGESDAVMEGGTMMQSMCGTPLYMAPEVLRNHNYSKQCDIWSIGVIMYTLLCGQQPFRSDEEGMLYDLIKTGKVTFEEDVWTTVSSSAKDLIRGMIQVNPADRMSAREILDHSWMTGSTENLGRRPTVIELMKEFREEAKAAEAQQEETSADGDASRVESNGDAKKSNATQKGGRLRPGSAAAGGGGSRVKHGLRARSSGDLTRHSPSPGATKPVPGYMKPTQSHATSTQTTKQRKDRLKVAPS